MPVAPRREHSGCHGEAERLLSPPRVIVLLGLLLLLEDRLDKGGIELTGDLIVQCHFIQLSVAFRRLLLLIRER